MADLTAIQLTDFRADVGDEGGSPAFTDDELNRLYARAGEDYDSAVVLAFNQLLANAAKFFNYTAGQTRIERRQVFENLKTMRDLKQSELASGGSQVVMAGMTPVPRADRDEPDDFERKDTNSAVPR